MGKVVEFQHQKSFTVTGVYENLPSASSHQFDFVLSFEYLKRKTHGLPIGATTAIHHDCVCAKDRTQLHFSEKIKEYIKGKSDKSNVSLFIQKFSERYLYGRYENGVQLGGRIEYVNLFSIIAVVILIIACINFMNLATALCSRKAKEVGIKKSIRAQRRSLVAQYISESMVLTVLSVLLSLALVWLILPQFNSITEKKISLLLNDPQLVIWLVAITVFTGIIAGSYPALYLSGFKPAAVLKGVVKGSWGELWARKGLVVFQFSISVF